MRERAARRRIIALFVILLILVGAAVGATAVARHKRTA
jgi:hypothetical protein